MMPISSQYFIGLLVLVMYLGRIGCPPVQPETKQPEADHKQDDQDLGSDPILNLEYHRYLKEVVNLLESDSKFKELIEKASPEDIKSGKIASQLQFVEHNVRTKLDELKRKEIDRLRELIARRAKLQNSMSTPLLLLCFSRNIAKILLAFCFY